jgi:hypothetical protein
MAPVTDAPTPPAPNAQALLAVAVDRDGKRTPASDALDHLRGEAPHVQQNPHAAAG